MFDGHFSEKEKQGPCYNGGCKIKEDVGKLQLFRFHQDYRAVFIPKANIAIKMSVTTLYCFFSAK